MNAPKKPAIPMFACKSNQVESLGHQGDTLAVKFKSGTYHYHGVTAAQFADLKSAESIGAALGTIKGKHKFTKQDQQPQQRRGQNE